MFVLFENHLIPNSKTFLGNYNSIDPTTSSSFVYKNQAFIALYHSLTRFPKSLEEIMKSNPSLKTENMEIY